MESSNDILERLKGKGCRFTRTRKAILDLILSAGESFSARELSEKLAKSKVSINKATLYRELAFLREEKVIRELSLCDKVRRYEAMTEHKHCHAVCVKCHRVECVELEEETILANKKAGAGKNFKVLDVSMEISGLCCDCDKD